MEDLTRALGQNQKHHEFSEQFIHQLIETIEFSLGTVSNTASYLRLWALSLAHSELSNVLFEKIMLMALETEKPYLIFLAQTIYWSLTFGILISMDLMEVFLHTLRLHWVEF